MTTWHKGPPPSIGWWPASMFCDLGCLRWWDGECWSAGARSYMTAEQAAVTAERKTWQGDIEWTERPASWPERART